LGQTDTNNLDMNFIEMKNMLKTLFRLFLPLACIFFLTACSLKTQPEKESGFADMYPVQGMNKELKLTSEKLSGPMAQGYAFFSQDRKHLKGSHLVTGRSWYQDIDV